jgi:phosphatidylserine/phosphatidylglycerophosphate/cardiolipin synthase-like enzyme
VSDNISKKEGSQTKDAGFRFNRKLHSRGISYDIQGLIYFRLKNYDNESESFKSRVKKICEEIGGEDRQGLFLFLTDSSVNYVYIAMTYFIPPKRLFRLKWKVYEKMAEFITKRSVA